MGKIVMTLIVRVETDSDALAEHVTLGTLKSFASHAEAVAALEGHVQMIDYLPDFADTPATFQIVGMTDVTRPDLFSWDDDDARIRHCENCDVACVMDDDVFQYDLPVGWIWLCLECGPEQNRRELLEGRVA